MLIVADCGTTNMRCRLVDNGKIISEVRRHAGSRNTERAGSTEHLRRALSECVGQLLTDNRLGENDVEAVVCSGILASDVGIYPIPHAVGPCSIDGSVAAARLAHLPDITSLPILFIPGVKFLPSKYSSDLNEYIDSTDSMSGEECEVWGILSALDRVGEAVITLPGSYNKVMEIDGEGKITSMHTGMCGEFIAAISEHTILRHSLPDPVVQRLLPDFVIKGFEFSREKGLSPALVKIRPLQHFAGWSVDEAANFFAGAILRDDILTVFSLCGKDKRIIVGGGDPLRSIFVLLLRHLGAKNTVELDGELSGKVACMGAISVYNKWKEANTGV